MMRTGLGLGEPGVVGGRRGPRVLGRTLLVSARAWGGVMGGGLWGSCSRPSQPELPMSHQAHLVQQKSTPWEQTIMNKILQKLLRTCEAFLEPIHPFHSTEGPGQSKARRRATIPNRLQRHGAKAGMPQGAKLYQTVSTGPEGLWPEG